MRALQMTVSTGRPRRLLIATRRSGIDVRNPSHVGGSLRVTARIARRNGLGRWLPEGVRSAAAVMLGITANERRRTLPIVWPRRKAFPGTLPIPANALHLRGGR